MLLSSAASSLVLFTIGPKKRQNDLVSVNKVKTINPSLVDGFPYVEASMNWVMFGKAGWKASG